jgi:hypothetical protein
LSGDDPECVFGSRSVFSEDLDRKGISFFSFSVREGRELIRSLTLEDPVSKAEVEAYAYNTVYKYEWS